MLPVSHVRLRRWAALVVLLGSSGCADDASEPAARCAPPAHHRPAGELLIAGSGAALAPLTVLLRRYRRESPATRLRLAASIGSSGALQALRDGAIDLGLSARHPRPAELSGLRYVALARVPLVFAAHPRTSLPRAAGSRLLRAIYAGQRRLWPDGAPIVPLSRQAGDATLDALAAAGGVLGGELERAARRVGAIVCYSDQQMGAALLAIPGAVGLLDQGTIELGELPLVRVPLPKPPWLELGLIHRESAPPALASFVAFARRTMPALARHGYRPAAGERWSPASSAASGPTTRPGER